MCMPLIYMFVFVVVVFELQSYDFYYYGSVHL
jgi:hypothetical protein